MQADMSTVFITDELARRGQVRPRLFLERLPMRDLALAMIDGPQQVLPRLVDRAMEATEAVSGGISLYEPEPAPGVFRWHNLRGDLEKFTGATAPRHDSPCGITLDQRKPILVQRPERVYKWLQDADVSLPECLLVPLYMGANEPLGTLWLVSSDEGHFDANHAEIANEISAFACLALRMAADQTRLKNALEQQDMLAREMSHRLKNVLAVVQSLVHMGAQQRGSAPDLAASVTSKIQALSAAHDLVQAWPESSGKPQVKLRDLLATILRPYSTHECRLEGPDTRLSPQASNVLALALHELATNAAKYGAFSRADGTLDVNWKHDGDRLRLTWTERGGPEISGEPDGRGFGSVLTSRSIQAASGSISRHWPESGLVVSIDLPLDKAPG